VQGRNGATAWCKDITGRTVSNENEGLSVKKPKGERL